MNARRVERYAVHLPVGLMIGVIESLPDAADRGQRELARLAERVEMQLRTAKVVGQFSAPHLRRLAADALEGRLDRMRAGSATPAPDGDTNKPTDLDRDANAGEPTRTAQRDESLELDRPPASRPPPLAATELPIDGYDQLSASQVVSSLAGLSVADLETLRRHETEGRQRRTVLTRISQLLGEGR